MNSPQITWHKWKSHNKVLLQGPQLWNHGRVGATARNSEQVAPQKGPADWGGAIGRILAGVPSLSISPSVGAGPCKLLITLITGTVHSTLCPSKLCLLTVSIKVSWSSRWSCPRSESTATSHTPSYWGECCSAWYALLYCVVGQNYNTGELWTGGGWWMSRAPRKAAAPFASIF